MLAALVSLWLVASCPIPDRDFGAAAAALVENDIDFDVANSRLASEFLTEAGLAHVAKRFYLIWLPQYGFAILVGVTPDGCVEGTVRISIEAGQALVGSDA